LTGECAQCGLPLHWHDEQRIWVYTPDYEKLPHADLVVAEQRRRGESLVHLFMRIVKRELDHYRDARKGKVH
jgi:hypothetical protein